jgi:hypothetical protein
MSYNKGVFSGRYSGSFKVKLKGRTVEVKYKLRQDSNFLGSFYVIGFYANKGFFTVKLSMFDKLTKEVIKEKYLENV